MKQKIVVRGFSLTDKEIKVIERVNRERSLRSMSAALRQILGEWDRWVRYRITEKGRQTLEAEQEELANEVGAAIAE